MTRVGLCAIVRNEARYLPEWLAWHRRVGVSRVYLYDNESTDDTLRAAEDEGAEVLDWPGGVAHGHSAQMTAYAHCLGSQDRVREVDWLLVLDADEFVWHPEGRPVPEVLDAVKQAGCVWMPWQLFGWGGHTRAPEGSTLTNYLYRAPDGYGTGYPKWGKSAVRVGVDVLVSDPHWFETMGGTEVDTGLLVNHYYTRSREEAYARRVARAREDFGSALWADVERIGDEASVVFDDRLARLSEAAWRT